jgi:hypothetical protein
MKKEFIPYELALKMKVLGFDEPCVAFYEESKRLSIGFNWLNGDGKNSNLQECTAPLYQQAFRWFRKEYDLNYVIVKAESWFYTINGCNTQEGFNTYEEAELACLKKLIEIVKSKQENNGNK